SIDRDKWRNEASPFSFTNLPTDGDLEFTVKVYPGHNGITERLSTLESGDHRIIGDAFGAIQYKGKGTFLAGGAGVTPFISILKSLEYQDRLEGNVLIFANKEERDIFLKDEFQTLLGSRFINILSQEKTEGHHFGLIDKEFLKSEIMDFSQYFYVCGPPPMVNDVISALEALGAEGDNIVIESACPQRPRAINHAVPRA